MQTLDPSTGCPLRWRRLSGRTKSGVRCQAPSAAMRRCPRGWRVQVLASRTRGGVTCTPGPPLARRVSRAPSSRASPRRPRTPPRRPRSSRARTQRPKAAARVPLRRCTQQQCPALFTVLTNGQCRGPIRGTAVCPKGFFRTRPSTNVRGVTCACPAVGPTSPRSRAPSAVRTPAIPVCPVGWSTMPMGGCRGPVGTNNCPAVGAFKLVLAPTATSGPVCYVLPSCPTTRTRSGSFQGWVRMSLGRCRAPRGVRRCPARWSSQAPATANRGVTCIPCLGGVCITNRRSSPPASVRPPRVTAAPSRAQVRVTAGPTLNGNMIPAGGCPPMWRALGLGSCEAPVSVTQCPSGNWRVELPASAGSGVICARVPACPTGWTRTTGGQCRSSRGVTTCPSGWSMTVPPGRRNPVVSCLAPLAVRIRTRSPISAPIINGNLLSTMCPPTWPIVTRSNGDFGGCQAPPQTTQCPTGPFEQIFAATATTGVVCARVPPCPTTAWSRLPNGLCRAPAGVASCPPYWQGTVPATATTGVVCLAPLSELNPTLRPTPRPTPLPGRPTASPTATPRPTTALPTR